MTFHDAGATEVDGGPARSDVAKQEAAAVTGTVSEQGSRVAGAVQEGGQRVVAEAANQVSQLAQEAQAQYREVLGRSQTEFTARASEQTEKAAGQLERLAGELSALVDGRPEDAPTVGRYLRQAGDRVQSYAGRLNQDGFAGVADDAGRFARRRPGAFLLGAVAAGFVAGRLARGAQAAGSDDGRSGGPPTSGTAPSRGPEPAVVVPLLPPPPPMAPSPLAEPYGATTVVGGTDPTTDVLPSPNAPRGPVGMGDR